MRSILRWSGAIGLFLMGLLLGRYTNPQTVAAQTRKPITISRLYTGPDGQTHAEEMELKLNESQVSEIFKVTSAEVHRAPAGRFSDWHTAPRRQFVITLSGQGEIEVAGGKKILSPPGHIELAEDLTGKGHITRAVGSEDRFTLQIPLADQTPR